MQASRPLLAFALVSVLLLAGCAGGGKSANASPTPTDPNVLPPGVHNVLEGTVQTTDLIPLEGARVLLNGREDNRTTDPAGYYRFENLEPGDYIVTSSLEGYRPKQQRAIIEEQKIFQLDFMLEEIPSTQPYHTLQEFRGKIACQVAYQTTPENTQRPNCGAVDPNNRQQKDFDIEPGAAQVQVELVWTQSTAGSRILTITAESLGDNGVQFAHDRGETGLKVVISQSLLRKNMPDGGKIRILVEAAPSITGDEAALDAGLAFQQDFTIYFTTFYIEPGPPSFSAIPK